MSKKKKKNDLNELLEEFFPDDGDKHLVIGRISKAEEEAPEPKEAPKQETAAPETETEYPKEETAESDAETASPEEEISEEDGGNEDIEVPVDKLEEDPSEAENADFSLAGDMEWETPEMPLGNAVTFDGERVSGNDGNGAETLYSENVPEEDTPETGTENGNGAETAYSENVPEEDSPETDTENGNDAETASEEDVSEDSADTPEPDAENDNDKKQNFFIRILRGLIPWKGDSVFEIIRKIIFLIAVIVFIGAGVMLISTLTQSQAATKDKEVVQSVITTTVATTVDSEGNTVTVPPTKEEIAEHNFNVAEYFRGLNEDYVGYLEIEGCDIYEPVMRGEDNEYYLTHNYYGGTNKGGTVFMDWRCTYTEDYVSPNIVIYGHNQEDGTMFGNLKKYKQDCKFYAENPVVKFSTENETNTYIIYGYFVTNTLEKHDSNGVVFHYHDYIETLSNEDTFNWYMEMVRERNQIVSPVDVRYGDQLLCLSTCSNEFSESRFVVMARKLREGESLEDIDFSNTYLNPNAKGVDWEAVTSDQTSEESTEETSETEETVETTEEIEINIMVEDFSEETSEETVTTVPEETRHTESRFPVSTLRPKISITKRPSTGTYATTTSEPETEVTTVPAETDENGSAITVTGGITDENGETLTDTDTSY